MGPGLNFRLQSDFIGPFPTTTVWTASIGTTAEGRELGEFQWRDQNNPTIYTLHVPDSRTTLVVDPRLEVPEGTTVHVNTVVQTQGGGPADDSGVATAVWSPTAGLTYQLQTQASGGGGLTTEEHGWLDQVVQFVQNTLVAGGTLATQLGAGGILDHPDLNLLSLCGSPIPLTGDGSLTRPRPGVGVEAYGLQYQVTLAPPGAGLLNGVIREYSARVCQFTAFYKDASSLEEYPVEGFDTHLDNGSWLWRNPFPSRIVYSVTTGFQLQARWLCLPEF